MSFGVSVGDFVAVLSLANKLRKDFVGAPSQYRSIAKEVRGLSIVLQDVDDQLPPSARKGGYQNPELDEISHGCHALLKELENELEKYGVVEYVGGDLQKKVISAWKRVTWQPKDIRELRDRLISNMTLLQSFLSAISSKTASATKELLDGMNQRQEDQEKSEILNWFTSVDHTREHNIHVRQRQPGTGQWLLDSPQYVNWIKTRQSSVLALGIPGAGKSICSAIVIDDLTDQFEDKQEEVGIAYLYCDFKRQEEQNVEELVSSLLKQLSQRRSDLPYVVKDLHGDCQRKSTRPRFDEILTALRAVVSLYSQVYIVIDALDECQSANGCRARLLDEIMKLQREAGMNIFATSRHIEIDDCLKEAALLEIRAREEDVRKFVRGNMHRLLNSVTRNVPLKEEIENTICHRVQGMFLLAELHIETLAGKPTAKSTRAALEELSGGRNAYDSAYEKAMQRINAQLPELKELAIKSLSWITFAKRPLTVLELQHALAIEKERSDLDHENIPDMEDVLSVCAGLLKIEHDIVRLVHYTAQEYFERTHKRWFVEFSETHISNFCLIYMSFETFGTGPCGTDATFSKRLEEYPFYVYVASHWGNHAREAQNCDPEVIGFLESGAKLEASVQALQAQRESARNWSQRFTKGAKALHLAAYFDFHQMVSLLLQCGHFVDTHDSDGRTPLVWTSMHKGRNHMPMIDLLLANGAYIDALDENDHTILHQAASKGDGQAVQHFLDMGADSNGRSDYETPVADASGHGHLSVVSLLLSRGADVNRGDLLWGTALERAFDISDLQIVELLLEKGADITAEVFSSTVRDGHEYFFEIFLAKTTSMHTPPTIYAEALCTASRIGNYSMVRVLLNNKADINAQCFLGQTPLIGATARGDISMVQFLLSHGANVDGNEGANKTALGVASEHGHLQLAEILLEHGANVNRTSGFHGTALLAASYAGHLQIVQTLLQHGANVDGSHGAHGTALWAASHTGRLQIVQTLLQHGANVDGSHGVRGTALHAASNMGNLQIVELLLQHGADPLIRCGATKTVLQSALQAVRKNQDIVELLRKHILEKRQEQVLDSEHSNTGLSQMNSIDSFVCN